jgi:hypothetical protein
VLSVALRNTHPDARSKLHRPENYFAANPLSVDVGFPPTEGYYELQDDSFRIMNSRPVIDHPELTSCLNLSQQLGVCQLLSGNKPDD